MFEKLPKFLEESTVSLEFTVFTEVPEYLEVEITYCDTEMFGTTYVHYN